MTHHNAIALVPTAYDELIDLNVYPVATPAAAPAPAVKHTFSIEITDTFAGEANYSWVRRYTFKAKSPLGAIRMLARQDGAGWVKDWTCGDTVRYSLKNACICAFVTFAE